jgi:hypothetical protein
MAGNYLIKRSFQTCRCLWPGPCILKGREEQGMRIFSFRFIVAAAIWLAIVVPIFPA